MTGGQPRSTTQTPGLGQCGENRAPPVREPICYGQGTPRHSFFRQLSCALTFTFITLSYGMMGNEKSCKGRVLVLDDDPPVLEILGDVLSYLQDRRVVIQDQHSALPGLLVPHLSRKSML